MKKILQCIMCMTLSLQGVAKATDAEAEVDDCQPTLELSLDNIRSYRCKPKLVARLKEIEKSKKVIQRKILLTEAYLMDKQQLLARAKYAELRGTAYAVLGVALFSSFASIRHRTEDTIEPLMVLVGGFLSTIPLKQAVENYKLIGDREYIEYLTTLKEHEVMVEYQSLKHILAQLHAEARPYESMLGIRDRYDRSGGPYYDPNYHDIPEAPTTRDDD